MSGNSHYEDIIFKTAHLFFGKELLPFWGITDEIEADNGLTELPLLILTNMYMDNTFLTTTGKYLHFEFQSHDGGDEDLRRFHSYEAHLHYVTKREVITYVIFTGGIKKKVYEEHYGINTYRTIPISMAEEDGDLTLSQLKKMQSEGLLLTREDLVKLALTPVMGGTSSIKDRILTAVSNNFSESQ